MGVVDATVGPRRTVRVLIADDSAVLVETLVAALARHSVLDVVATAADGPSTLAAVRYARPDVVLMDLRLGGDWGLDLVPAMVAGEHPPAVVVFSAASHEVAHEVARHGGVTALLSKGVPLQEVFDTLLAAAPPRDGTAHQS